MPWKECSVTDERMQFVARRLAGEAMAELCREFAISRKGKDLEWSGKGFEPSTSWSPEPGNKST